VKVVSLDVHAEASQLCAVTEEGEVLLEMKVATDPAILRTIIGGIPGPKRVVFEEGPLSGRLMDALKDVADEVISCDPARNAMIARSENSNDERDARRLALLTRAGAIHPVWVPPEPYRTLRSLLVHDERMQSGITSVQNRIKALCRRTGTAYRGGNVYRSKNRPGVLEQIESPGLRWQMDSLYRQFDLLRRERAGARQTKKSVARKLPEVARFETAPGVGAITAQTLAAWVADPTRFHSRSALNSYAGLGLGQGFTNWAPIGKAKASKRGQRQLKRVLFLAANVAVRGDNALARRYQARTKAGWEHGKAIRDIARMLLWTLCALWRTGTNYDDSRIKPLDTTDR
jgi:transposase